MIKWVKRTIAYLLIGAFALLSCSCGKNGDDSDNGNFYCKMEEIELEQLESKNLLNRGDQVIVYGKSMDEMTMQAVEKFIWLQDGAVADTVSLPIAPDESFELVTISESGDIYVITYTNRVLNPKDDEESESDGDTQGEDAREQQEAYKQKNERHVYRNNGYNADSDSESQGRPGYLSGIDEHERQKRLRAQNEKRPDGALDFSDHVVKGTERNEIKQDSLLHVADRFKPEKPVVEEAEPVENPEDAEGIQDGEEMLDGDEGEIEGDFIGETDDESLANMDVEDAVETEEEYGYYLVRYDRSGQQIFAKNLFEDKEFCSAIDNGLYFESLVVDEENIYLCNGTYYAILDSMGTFKEAVKFSKLSTKIQEYGVRLLYDNVGDIYLDFMQPSGENCVAPINLVGKSLGSIYDTGELYFINIYPGGSEKFLINKTGTVMGFNCDNKGLTKVLDPMASDLSIGNLRDVAAVDADHYYGIYSDLEGNGSHLGYFSHVDASSIPKKENLTLVTVTMNSDVNKMVSEFNSSNPDYRINLVNYSSLYGSSDYFPDENVIEKLNTEIIAGNVPDMLLVTEGVPLGTYIGKGLIQDINPYIEADEEITEENYLLSVMRRFEQEGKLYRLVPSFYVDSLVVKKSLLGEKTSWTIDDVNRIMEEKGCEKFLDFYSRPEILGLCMSQAGSQFVDYENSKCYFDTDNFKKMIAFIKTFPADYSYDGYDDTAIRTNKQLSERIYLANFRTLNIFEQADFGEEVVLVGFPSDNGSGSTLVSDLQICMSTKSKHKDICWDFMKLFLENGFQESDSLGTFPMKRSAWEKARERSKEKPFWIDEQGNKNEYDETFFMGGQEIVIEPPSDEKLDRYEKMVFSVDKTNEVDQKVIEILTEELQGYFEDKVSAESAAKRIQSRVQIYLYECE